MNESASISSIGLAKNETTVLHSILRIMQNITHNLSVIDPSEFGAADLLFVNAGDTRAEKELRKLREHNDNIVEITIGEKSKPDIDSVTLKRPIVMKRVKEALELALKIRSKKWHEDKIIQPRKRTISRLLVVDDSAPVRTYMGERLPELCDKTLDINFAADGKEALTKLQNHIYDAVFLDVIMPDIDGYKICKWLKSIHPQTKIIMLTSKKSPFDKVRGSMSGCDAYITKPPNETKLIALLQKITADQVAHA